jgi:hypothetical protein
MHRAGAKGDSEPIGPSAMRDRAGDLLRISLLGNSVNKLRSDRPSASEST